MKKKKIIITEEEIKLSSKGFLLHFGPYSRGPVEAAAAVCSSPGGGAGLDPRPAPAAPAMRRWILWMVKYVW